MYSIPDVVEHPFMTNMTANESYETLFDRSNAQSQEYISMNSIQDYNTRSLFSNKESTFTGQDRPPFPPKDRRTFSGQDKSLFSGPSRTVFTSQDEEIARSHHKQSNKKFIYLCVTFGIVTTILLFISLIISSIGLWMSLSSRADTKELQESQANFGLVETSPAASCFYIHLMDPFAPSDYYWVKSMSGSALRVYCDMKRSCGGITGGWTRLANVDFSNASVPCPAGLVASNDAGIRTCGIESSTPICVSVMLPSSSVVYTHVCGRVNAYQYGSTDAFYRSTAGLSIDNNYVDGVSLTYGSLPRKHIWTFAAALDDTLPSTASSCECMTSNDENVTQNFTPSPSFVGQDYFCATGSHAGRGMNFIFYESDILWDGVGCVPNSMCCSFNGPPWFYKQLPSATTEDIEMRVCCDEDESEDVSLTNVEIYVQ